MSTSIKWLRNGQQDVAYVSDTPAAYVHWSYQHTRWACIIGGSVTYFASRREAMQHAMDCLPQSQTHYTVDVKVQCPFCHTRQTFPNMELSRDEPYVASTECTYCEHSYYYVVDNGNGQPSQHPHVVCLRPSEYRAIVAHSEV